MHRYAYNAGHNFEHIYENNLVLNQEAAISLEYLRFSNTLKLYVNGVEASLVSADKYVEPHTICYGKVVDFYVGGRDHLRDEWFESDASVRNLIIQENNSFSLLGGLTKQQILDSGIC